MLTAIGYSIAPKPHARPVPVVIADAGDVKGSSAEAAALQDPGRQAPALARPIPAEVLQYQPDSPVSFL